MQEEPFNNLESAAQAPAAEAVEKSEQPESNFDMLRKLLHLALPSMAGTVSLALMQFVDGWMVSILDRQNPHDAVNLAATFNGGIAAAVPMMFFVGLGGAVSTLVSQSSGRKLDDEP